MAHRPGKAGRYSLERWLAADGDGRATNTVTGTRALSCDAAACVGDIRGKRIAVIHHPSALAEKCSRANIVVAKFPLRGRCRATRVTLDRLDLLRAGAHAFYLDGQSIRFESVAAKRGNRPWTRTRPAPAVTARRGEGAAHVPPGGRKDVSSGG